MERNFKINKKWVLYAVELFVVYLIQYTPSFFPKFFNVTPNLLLTLAVSVAVFEGEKAGMWYGMAAGMLMDFAGYKIMGFNALFMAILCYICGYLVTKLMRNNALTTVILSLCVAIILGVMRWFFFYVLWGMPDVWYEFYAITLPIILLSWVFSPVFYIINKTVSNTMPKEEF